MATLDERAGAVLAGIRDFRAAHDAQLDKVFAEVKALKDTVASGGTVTEATIAGLETELVALADTKERLQVIDDIDPDETTEPAEPGDDESDEDEDVTTG